MPSGKVKDTISLNRGNLTFVADQYTVSRWSATLAESKTNALKDDQRTVNTTDGVVSDPRCDGHHPWVCFACHRDEMYSPV